MSDPLRRRRTAGALALAVAAAVTTWAAPARAADPESPPEALNSALDAPLFYQLLIGEIELRAGQPGTAYEVILDAARRTNDDRLFRRAVDIALQGRAGEQALTALRAWRSANPRNADAMRLQLQILTAVNRLPEAAEPLRALLELTPAADRPALIHALPRFLARSNDLPASARLIEEVLQPYLTDPATRSAAHTSIGRGWLAAADTKKALALAEAAHREDPLAPGPVLLALELLGKQPASEKIVGDYLAHPGAQAGMRLGYVRALTGAQRYADAIEQLEIVTRQQPQQAEPFLSLGALYLELRQPAQGEAALKRYIELAQAESASAPAASPAASAADAAASAAEVDNEADPEAVTLADEARAGAARGLVQARLMLAQSAEQRGDYAAAESYLAQVDDPQRALEVQSRRASILARQGRVDEARALIRQAPEHDEDDIRAKLVAESGMLREIKRWQDAYEVLARASERFAGDADLVYEQAMMAEKLDRMDEMERLLRRVIELKPDNAHAYNALGYSLADRRMRLDEARQLVQRALELAPGDPFITDSLGWVEYRLGNRDEALRLLHRAYATRPDPEIAAHLGEVLWSYGQQDEARRVWREAKGRDGANDVLRETLSRLKVGL